MVSVHGEPLLLTSGKLDQNAMSTEIHAFSAFRVLTGLSTNVAQAIYYSADTYHARTKLLVAVATTIEDEEIRALVKALCAACEKAHKQRQQIMHGVLAFESPDSTMMTLIKPRAQNQRKTITEAYLSSLVAESHDALFAAVEAFRKLCDKRGVAAAIELL